MAKLTFLEALRLSLNATKKYIDDKTAEDSEEDTLNLMLKHGLVSNALMLEDGTYLTDSDGKLLEF